jgi:hypothetical protein
MPLRFSIRDLLWLTLVAAVVLGFLVFIYVRKPPVQRWEYQWIYSAGTPAPLNKEGDNGWEACGVSDSNRGSVLMKRPKS